MTESQVVTVEQLEAAYRDRGLATEEERAAEDRIFAPDAKHSPAEIDSLINDYKWTKVRRASASIEAARLFMLASPEVRRKAKWRQFTPGHEDDKGRGSNVGSPNLQKEKEMKVLDPIGYQHYDEWVARGFNVVDPGNGVGVSIQPDAKVVLVRPTIKADVALFDKSESEQEILTPFRGAHELPEGDEMEVFSSFKDFDASVTHANQKDEPPPMSDEGDELRDDGDQNSLGSADEPFV